MNYPTFERRQREKERARQKPEVDRAKRSAKKGAKAAKDEALGAVADRLKAFREGTGGIPANGQQEVTFYWPEPFSSSAYTVSADIEQGNAIDTLSVRKIVSKTATSVTVRLVNNDSNNRSGTIHIIGIPD